MSQVFRQRIYTDGSFYPLRNLAGLGVYYGRDDKRNASMSIVAHEGQMAYSELTSSTVELCAILFTLSQVNQAQEGNSTRYEILTDSMLSLGLIEAYKKTQTGAFKRGSFKFSLLKEISELSCLMNKSGKIVNLRYVRGHLGIEGNVAADRLARKGLIYSQFLRLQDCHKLAFN